MPLTTEERCCVDVHTAGMMMGRYSQCSRRGSIKRRGKLYCKQHDPVAVKKRDDENRIKFHKEMKRRVQHITDAREAPGLRKAIKKILALAEVRPGRGWAVVSKIAREVLGEVKREKK